MRGLFTSDNRWLYTAFNFRLTWRGASIHRAERPYDAARKRALCLSPPFRPPNSLRRNGWTKEALKEGDMVTVEGIRAKDPVNAEGAYVGNARNVTLPGGKRVFSGSAEDGGKQQ